MTALRWASRRADADDRDVWLAAPARSGVKPAEQHQDRGAAVLMTAGGAAFASLRVQSVAAITIAICRSAQCELSACVHPQIAVHPTVTDGESGCQHIDDLPLGQLSLRIG